MSGANKETVYKSDYATGRSGAAGTLLLDIKTRDWSAEVLQALYGRYLQLYPALKPIFSE